MGIRAWLSASELRFPWDPFFSWTKFADSITVGMGRLRVNFGSGEWGIDWQGDDDRRMEEITASQEPQ